MNGTVLAGVGTLLYKEVLRFWKVSFQTVAEILEGGHRKGLGGKRWRALREFLDDIDVGLADAAEIVADFAPPLQRPRAGHAGIEARLGQAQHEPQSVEGWRAFHPDEGAGQQSPGDHDTRDPHPRPDLVHQDVGRHLEHEIGQKENAGPGAEHGRRQSQRLVHRQRGEADIYPRLSPTREWDVAAGCAILAAAGGTVIRPQGGPLQFGRMPEKFLVPGFIALGDPSIMATLPAPAL